MNKAVIEQVPKVKIFPLLFKLIHYSQHMEIACFIKMP